MHFLWASVFHYQRLDILRDSIEHPSQNLLSFEFGQSFFIQFRVSLYITGLNQTFEEKVIVIWFCSELLFSILSVLIYEGTQSDIWLKSYCCFNLLRVSDFNFVRLDILQDSIGLSVKTYYRLSLLRASVFNFERLELLRDSIGHPSQKLLLF